MHSNYWFVRMKVDHK